LSSAGLPICRLHGSPRLVPQLLRQSFLLVRQLEVRFVRSLPVKRRDLRNSPAASAHQVAYACIMAVKTTKIGNVIGMS